MEQNVIKILLVEDADTDVEIVKRALDKEFSQKYYLLRASSMAEAECILKTGNANIDIILLDLGLPDTNGGRDTFTQLTDINEKNIPIVVLTSTDDQKLALEIISWGAQYYICKSSIMQNKKSLSKVVDFSLCRHRHKQELKQSMHAKVAEKEQILNWMTGSYSC